MKLIIAPHADDESLGCGGLIAKEPWDAAVAVLSDKGDGRMDEFYAAKAILQYDHVYLAEFQTGELAANSRMVTTWMDAIIRSLQPTELYLPMPGAHQDHIAAYEAGVRAARLSYTDDAWFVPNVYLYDVPSYATDLYTVPYAWNRYVSLSDEDMRRKAEAIRAYGSQSKGRVRPDVLAEEHASFTGSKINVAWAEQYAVVREVTA